MRQQTWQASPDTCLSSINHSHGIGAEFETFLSWDDNVRTMNPTMSELAKFYSGTVTSISSSTHQNGSVSARLVSSTNENFLQLLDTIFSSDVHSQTSLILSVPYAFVARIVGAQ